MSDTYTPRISDEVWVYVFEYFEGTLPTSEWWMEGAHVDWSQLTTLQTLCHVCHQFKRCAQPILRRSLLLENPYSDSDKAFQRLIRELMLDPGLGRPAGVISVRDYLYENVPESLFKEQIHSSLAVMDLPPRFRQFLNDSHFKAKRISPATLCLLFTPNVKLLDITVGTTPPLLLSWFLSGSLELEKSSFLPKWDEDKVNRDFDCYYRGNEGYGTGYDDERVTVRPYANFGLPQLKEVRLKHGSNETATPIIAIEAAFMHPGVEIMRTVGIDWTSGSLAKRQWPELVSHVKTLELKECAIDTEGLEDVFKLCPQLEILRIELGNSRRTTEIDLDEANFDLDAVGDIIREYGKRLTELDLHTVEYDDWVTGTVIGSLQDLTKLCHLRILKRNLVGSTPYYTGEPEVPHLATSLPFSLETLYLHYDKEFYSLEEDEDKCKILDKEIFELITSGELPNLYEVKAERHGIYSNPFEHTIQGWESEIHEEHLWNRTCSTGAQRTIMAVSKKI